MPGPRARGKTARSKPAVRQNSTATVQLSSQFVTDIENAEGWNTLMGILCDFFDIPDLTTRSGFKKIHVRFNDIHKKLDEVFRRNADNDKIAGGIVGIWAKMCDDAILRDKLFREGFVSKVMLWIDRPTTRHVGLQALTNVTHHGGVEVRQELARHTGTLLRAMKAAPDDPKVIELCTITMAHAIGAVVLAEKPDRTLVKAIDMPAVLRATTENLKKPFVSFQLFTHAQSLLTASTLHFSTECKAQPALIAFLVACLRSTQLTVRCNALGGLVRLHQLEAEPDTRMYDPRKMMEQVRKRIPDHLSDIMMDYGPHACDTVATLTATAQFQRAIMQAAQDRDLYALGKTQAALILRTEFAIPEGMFQYQDERTGRVETHDAGLPFTMWTDSLPFCARALRAGGAAADLDMADIVEMKHLVLKQRIPEAVALAHAAAARNPQLAYAYYVVGLGADDARGLRAVKKGLKCRQVTPFVRNYMLWRAVEHAGNMGVEQLQEARAGEADYAEGVAFLQSALEDAKAFVAQAPPDNRNMQTILNWYVLLTLALRGPELAPDLHDLEDVFKKLGVADEFCKLFGAPAKRTQLRLTRELIVSTYSKALAEWGAVVAHVDALSPTARDPDMSPGEAQDELAAWLEKIQLDDGHALGPQRCGAPALIASRVSIYRCTWCGNPSAVLRKCSGCGQTRCVRRGCSGRGARATEPAPSSQVLRHQLPEGALGQAQACLQACIDAVPPRTIRPHTLT
ncbi:hypothetical protein AcV7_001571 [Taiwanofungus camphoratus]|nr:hypothetical protein AcV7_001571 [Antrodia cinnamomea]